jgi:hypothetical protein
VSALIGVMATMAYLVVSGIVGAVVFTRLYDPHDYDDPIFPAFFAGVFWPITLPLSFGIWIGRAPVRARERAVETKERAAKAKQRERELEKELGFKDPTPKLEDLQHWSRRGGDEPWEYRR